MIWRNWLPVPQQMSDAVQLRRNAYENITMQQAMGMIVILGLLSGFLPFIVNWIMAARMDAALPLAQAARASANFPNPVLGLLGIDPVAWNEFYPTLAGLPQPLPGWLAAGLSALGTWINWPLHWLGFWIVYGALVVVVDKALGATMTLQRFYAATGYIAVPLLLTSLSPIPCVGGVAVLLSVIWATAVYLRANQDIAGFSLARSAVAVFLPAVLLLLLGLLIFGSFLLTFVFTVI